MRLEKKQEISEELAARLADVETLYLTDFTGLNVKAITELRARLRAEGLELRVVKNTLTRRALAGLDLPEVEQHLEGPTALLLGVDDPVMPAKVLRDFAKEHDDRPVIKIAVIDRRPVTPETVAAMADLPPRDELLGWISGALTGAVSGIVNAIDSLIRDTAWVMEEVAKKQAAGAAEEGAD